MRAQQFIKDHGVEKAREVVEGEPEGATQYELTVDGDFYFKRDRFNWYCFGDKGLINTYMDDYESCHLIDLRILKRLVESVDLIKYLGGYERTKARLQMARKNGTTFGIDHMKWKQAIADYESIYGEGNDL